MDSHVCSSLQLAYDPSNLYPPGNFRQSIGNRDDGRKVIFSMSDKTRKQGQEHNDQQDQSEDTGADDAILHLRAAGGFSIWNARKSNHRIKREINSRQRGFEEVIEFFLCPECFRRGFVAHLNEISDRKIGKSVGVYFSAGKIFGEGALAVVWKFFEAFVEDYTIFEGSVHPLSIKRHDRVRSVADQRDLVFVIPW